MPPGAVKAAFPAHVVLELATLVEAVPAGDDWVHEIDKRPEEVIRERAVKRSPADSRARRSR